MDFPLLWNYLPFLLVAAGTTLWISFLSLVFGSLLGLGLALLRVFGNRWIAGCVWVYVWLIRGTPMLLQIFVIYYWLPSLGIILPAFTAGVLALSINSAGYFVDIFRAGILSVPAGQIEAGYGVGLAPWQVLSRIILPLAARPALPPYIGQAINLVKNSSLVSVISVQELMFTAQSIYSSTYKIAEILGAAGLLYLAINTILQVAQTYIERRLNHDTVRS
jgi:His/Glu/Gln/Arg/opine family amino acid ABC transporter permease subunit